MCKVIDNLFIIFNVDCEVIYVMVIVYVVLWFVSNDEVKCNFYKREVLWYVKLRINMGLLRELYVGLLIEVVLWFVDYDLVDWIIDN